MEAQAVRTLLDSIASDYQQAERSFFEYFNANECTLFYKVMDADLMRHPAQTADKACFIMRIDVLKETGERSISEHWTHINKPTQWYRMKGKDYSPEEFSGLFKSN